MDRFTKKTERGAVLELFHFGVPWTVEQGDGFRSPRYAISGAAVNRLAAYEDTGLEPEEIVRVSNKIDNVFQLTQQIDLKKLEHIKELADAENEGRLVVLPCRVGDTVYVPGYKGKNDPHIVEVYIRDLLDAVQYMDKIGKTVFLTREEAEAALAKEVGGV